MSLETILENLVLQNKRIADRLEMIHNHFVNLPEKNPKLDAKLEEEEVEDEIEAGLAYRLDEEEAPKSVKGSKAVNATAKTAKERSKAAPASVEKNLTENDVRVAANAMIKSCIKSVGDKDKGVKEGKKHVKRVLGEFEVELIEELSEDQYKNAVRAFERVAGTFAPSAEESDDLDI